MNVAVPLPLRQPPTARELLDLSLSPYVLLGMPHLAPTGLSETWLMKELGHRHWLMLARHLGMENADFRTADGRKVYASICASSMRHARLNAAQADDVLEIRSVIIPLSRCQVSSRHRIMVDAHLIAEVELISAFVTRRTERDNYSLTRVEQGKDSIESFGNSELADAAGIVRRHAELPYLGISLDDAAKPLLTFTPDYVEDFNGADLLYFAQFQAIFRRAAQHVGCIQGANAVRRDIFFYGNVQPGEPLEITLEGLSAACSSLSCKMTRQDGKVIARYISCCEMGLPGL